MAELTEDDRGKSVVMGDENVGTIRRVEDGRAYVDPDPDDDLTDQVEATLDWGDADEDTYLLPDEAVETITNTEVRLRSQM